MEQLALDLQRPPYTADQSYSDELIQAVLEEGDVMLGHYIIDNDRLPEAQKFFDWLDDNDFWRFSVKNTFWVSIIFLRKQDTSNERI